MSHAKVYLNGSFVGEWPYGYASFGFELTDKINFGNANLLAVRLENKPNSSRWYPGAGIYRNVRLVATQPVRVKQWGTYISTPEIEKGNGNVKIETILDGWAAGIKNVRLTTNLFDAQGKLVSTITNPVSNLKTVQELTGNPPSSLVSSRSVPVQGRICGRGGRKEVRPIYNDIWVPVFQVHQQ